MIANKSDRKGIIKGRIIICAIFALLFSQVIVAGNRVHYVDIRARYTDNYIAYDASAILIGVLLALIIFPISMLVFEAIRRISSFVAVDKESGTISGSFFVIAWMIIGLCWLPYLLTFYPGGLVGDGVEVLKRAITPGFPESAHWSILYALIMRGVLNLASIIFEDINNRVFVYAILEYVIYSGICAYTCFVLRKRGGVFKSFSYGFVLMYAFSGFFATYSFTFGRMEYLEP